GVPWRATGTNIEALYDGSTGESLRRIERRHDPAVVGDIRRSNEGDTSIRFLTFTPDGKSVGAASWDRAIHFFDVKTGEAVRQFGGKELPASHFALSPDGKTLAASDNSKLRLYDVATNRVLREISTGNVFTFDLVFAPDGKTLATAGMVSEGAEGWDGVVRLWKVPSGERLGEIPRCFAQHVAFAPDGKTLATVNG